MACRPYFCRRCGEQDKGRVKEVEGRIKQVAGKLAGDEKLEEKGKIQKTMAPCRSPAGDFVRAESASRSRFAEQMF